MKKKPSNSLRGSATRGSREHGLNLSKTSIRDAATLKKNSNRIRTTTVKMPVAGAAERASFGSDISAMRRDVRDNHGYRIPRLIEGPAAVTIPPKPRRGAPQKLQPAYSEIMPGEPDLDAGVDGWEKPDDTREFTVRGNRMDALLATINRVEGTGKIVTRAPESSRLEDQGSGLVERVKCDAAGIGMRDTLVASPAISRALQRMIEDGFLDEARSAAEAGMEPIGREYEGIFKGAKATSMVDHLNSGHFHYDIWTHASYRGMVGNTPVRLWDARATSHHGPGPGVTFWMRHLDVLGDLDELAKTEPEAAAGARFTKMVCDEAIASCAKRSREAFEKVSAEKAAVEAAGGVYDKWIRPADDYCRDIRITRAVDLALIKAINSLKLPKNYVAIGRDEYRSHLLDAYKNGNTGLRMDTAQDLATAAGVAKRAEARVREEAAKLRESEAKLMMAGAKIKKTWADMQAREAALAVREANITELTRKAGLWDRAEGLVKRMIELWAPGDRAMIEEVAAADTGITPAGEITSVRRVLARMARMAGVFRDKEREI